MEHSPIPSRRSRASPNKGGRFNFDKKVNLFNSVKQLIFAGSSAGKSLTKGSSMENVITSFSAVASSPVIASSRPRVVFTGKNGRTVAKELEPTISYNSFLERVFSFLTPLDRCLLSGASKMFHQEVFHPRYCKSMDFRSGPNFKIPAGLISLKVAYCSAGLRYLELPDHLKHTDYKK